MALLRDGLLDGQRIAVAGPVREGVRTMLERLGAETLALELPVADDQDAEQWASESSPLHGLVYDAAAAFEPAGEAGMGAALAAGWPAIRAVAAGALIPAQAGGRNVLVAPAAGAGRFVEATRSGLENLARTLSTEWARYRITTTMLAPGPETADEDLATLVAFLFSPGGAYFSGCRLELDGLVAAGRPPPS